MRVGEPKRTKSRDEVQDRSEALAPEHPEMRNEDGVHSQRAEGRPGRQIRRATPLLSPL